MKNAADIACGFSAFYLAMMNAQGALKKDWEEQQKDEACAQTAEKEMSGHQESYDLCPTCGTALGNLWEHKEPFHDIKKAESFTSSNGTNLLTD